MTRWMTAFAALFLIVSSLAAQDTGFTGDVTTTTNTNVFGAHVAYITSTGDTVAQTMTVSAGHYSLAVSPTAITEQPSVPTTFHLQQNYPNPLNPGTTPRYGLPKNTRIRITVYDLMGREVTTLVNTNQSAGWHSVQWNGRCQWIFGEFWHVFLPD